MMTNNNFSHFCFLLKSNQNPFFLNNYACTRTSWRKTILRVCKWHLSYRYLHSASACSSASLSFSFSFPKVQWRPVGLSTICWLASLPLASLKLFVIVGAFVCWQTLFPNFDGRCRHRGTLVQTRVGAHK